MKSARITRNLKNNLTAYFDYLKTNRIQISVEHIEIEFKEST
jgi:hypothetical protein